MAMSFEQEIANQEDALTAAGTMRPNAPANDPDDDAGDEGQQQQPQAMGGPLTEQLNATTTEAARAGVMAELLRDPDFAALMQHKAKGTKVKLVSESESPSAPVKEPENLDELTPSKLLEVMASRMTGVVNKAMDAKLQPIMQQVNASQQFLQQQQVKAAQTEVARAQKQYPDFQAFVPKMTELNKEFPTMGIDELYVMAKVRSGVPLTPPTGLQSERPSSDTTRSVRKTPLPPGRQGMSMALDQALTRVMSRDSTLE